MLVVHAAIDSYFGFHSQSIFMRIETIYSTNLVLLTHFRQSTVITTTLTTVGSPGTFDLIKIQLMHSSKIRH